MLQVRIIEKLEMASTKLPSNSFQATTLLATAGSSKFGNLQSHPKLKVRGRPKREQKGNYVPSIEQVLIEEKPKVADEEEDA